MEKYVVTLVIASMMMFAICTFPILGKIPDDIYVVSDKGSVARNVLESDEIWSTSDYTVFRLTENDKKYANAIPGGRKIEEYFVSDGNNIQMCDPFLQAISSNGLTVFGAPYVIS